MKRAFKTLLVGLIFLNLAYAEVIEVGSGNAYKPYSYVDEDGNAEGFDVAILKELERYDEELNFHFNPVVWNVVFIGLDSKKWRIIAHNITKTKEREEKYIFTDIPYFQDLSVLIVGERSNIKSFEDLKGKKVAVNIGDNHALNLEKYLKSHPDLNIKVVYLKAYNTKITELLQGKVAAIIDNPIAAADIAKAQGGNIKPTNVILQSTPVFYVFNKQDIELKNRISIALQKAIDDGVVDRLIIKYFGEQNANFIKNISQQSIAN